MDRVEMYNRRKHYRVIYPITERPSFAYNDTLCEVIECSERGIRFRAGDYIPPLRSRIVGRIALRHGQDVEISGVVIRKNENAVAVHLDLEAIPFAAIMREQLYLRKLHTSVG